MLAFCYDGKVAISCDRQSPRGKGVWYSLNDGMLLQARTDLTTIPTSHCLGTFRLCEQTVEHELHTSKHALHLRAHARMHKLHGITMDCLSLPAPAPRVCVCARAHSHAHVHYSAGRFSTHNSKGQRHLACVDLVCCKSESRGLVKQFKFQVWIADVLASQLNHARIAQPGQRASAKHAHRSVHTLPAAVQICVYAWLVQMHTIPARSEIESPHSGP